MKIHKIDREKQKLIWDEKWKNQSQISPQDILNSHSTQEVYRCLKNFIDAKKDKLILEAGCGTGRFCSLIAKSFPNSQIAGMDISKDSLQIANRLKEYFGVTNIMFCYADLFRMPYPKGYFDVVFNEGVIEHFSLQDPLTYKDALREMIRVAKPGGKIIVAVPNWFCFPHTLYKWLLKKTGKQFAYGYEKSFRRSELLKLFEESGLINLETKGCYPAHGFYRLGGHSRIFSLLGKLIDLINNNFISDRFGFMLFVKGEKPYN